MRPDFHIQQKIDECKRLFIRYGGRHHELIEKEMRVLGWTQFSRRILYSRNERGRSVPGWIDRFGWRELVTIAPAKRRCKCNRQAARRVRKVTERKGRRITSTDDPFHAWLKQVSPSMRWDWDHQKYIYERLQKITSGECKRLMIFLPPRHGKSELVTVRYAGWRIKQDPTLNVIVGSYNQRLANRFSRKIRRVLSDDVGLEMQKQRDANARATAEFGQRARSDKKHLQTASNSLDQNDVGSYSGEKFNYRRANSEAEWETSKGGGLRAVGVGSGVTGFGAGLIIVDDPVKSRAEAESATYREKIWDWFNDDLYTRLEPNGAIILIQTRWHEDDLAGRLLREMQEEDGEQWEVINLPALAEDVLSVPPAAAGGLTQESTELGINNDDGQYTFDAGLVRQNGSTEPPATAGDTDPLGRTPGQALCPERYDEEALEKVKRKLGSYSFAALYQQRPVPAEGGLFKRAWFKNIVSFAPPGLRWKRGYDLAMSKNPGSDFTASYRVAVDRNGDMYIDGGFRKRIEYPEQRRYILGRIESERDTEHGIELSANGNAVIQDLRREKKILGRMFRGVKVKGDKLTRALPWIALAEEGRVHLVRGAWNTEFIDEACSFPLGTHDDQIDAVSLAFRLHQQHRNRLIRF